MSMPSYPPHGAGLTKEEALTMVVASIAMEELALSHILNAEGEKLQYILGTLTDRRRSSCAGTQDILAVNKSVTGLLEAVLQNQMLLKGKLEKTLEAFGYDSGPGESEPCSPPCGDHSLCCCEKSGIQLVSRCSGFAWKDGCLLPWQLRARRGNGVRWNKNAPALVCLDPDKAYTLNYTVNVRGPACGAASGAILVKCTPQDAFFDVPPLQFSPKCLGESATLQCSAALFPQRCTAPYASAALLLDDRDGLYVDWAVLNVMEA